MKKYLFGALALPLLFACSSEDFDEKVVSNDQFAGIAKVEATFSMDEGATTRMDNGSWNPQEGDLWGFAWMGDGTVIPSGSGLAYQNHNLIQTNGIFTPQTAIYVGDYYIYRPYDKTTVSPQAINFESLVEQDIDEGFASSTQAWKDLAKTAINIGDKWTNVTATGWKDLAGNTWDKAGIKEHYQLYAAMFSNQTGLDMTYKKNNVEFNGTTKIKGATDIEFTPAKGTKVGAADIYKAEVTLAGAAQSFTYAPTKEPNTAKHDGDFWADKSNLPTAGQDGFTFTAGKITLNAPEDGISTDNEENKGWIWFNSLPVTAGNGTATTAVNVDITSSYGIVNVNKALSACAYVFEQPDGAAATAPKEWIKIVNSATNQTKSPKEWNLGDAGRKTFINQYGNHKGKYVLDVDFSKGVMNGMHIKNDAHLQKALKYYLASGKTETGAVLNLDKDADNEFKISKISIALLQTINATTNKVLVQACAADPKHTPAKVVVTQDGQDEWGLADKTEVPALNKVFAVSTAVFLSSDYDWTWSNATPLPVDANVGSLVNEGDLTVNADNIQLSTTVPIYNYAGATMNITKVTTVKNTLVNRGTINVPAGTELRAYDVEIRNDALSLTSYGVINNAGVVGVTYATTGTVNNYGKIIMESSDAITLLTSNQTAAGNFDNAFNAGTNKLGTVVLPAGQPNALVSVSNGAETGFIEYTWTGGTVYSTPNGGIVKYNTLIVSDNIAFTTAENEISFIKFEGVKKTVTNSTNLNLPNLKGIIIKDNCSIIIEKSNTISCSEGSHLGTGAAIYNGGAFNPGNTNIAGKIVTDYLGTWNTDQVVVW